MIQRIQSLYLLLAALLMGALFFFPLANFLGGTEVYKLYAWGIRTTGENPQTIVPAVYMGILLSLAVLVPLVTIFLFKNRWLQIRLCIVEIILLVGMQIYVALYLYKSWAAISENTAHKMAFSLVDIFPLLSILFIYLAFRGIVKDAALIKSLNRIR